MRKNIKNLHVMPRRVCLLDSLSGFLSKFDFMELSVANEDKNTENMINPQTPTLDTITNIQ